jgi:hypothetical protein
MGDQNNIYSTKQVEYLDIFIFEKASNGLQFVDFSNSNLITFDDITIEPFAAIPSDYIGLQMGEFFYHELNCFSIL